MSGVSKDGEDNFGVLRRYVYLVHTDALTLLLQVVH